MPKSSDLDISPGSVLHIKAFSTRGHPPKNKFCVVLGTEGPSTVLVFLISSQVQYRQQADFRDEIVAIPRDAVHFLSQESFIQCFTLEKLDVDKLRDGLERGMVDRRGRLDKKYLYKVRDAVKGSKLLSQQEIDLVLGVLSLE